MNNRTVICQLFGCLMASPGLLGQVDKYNLSLTDFTSRFDKYIYTAIRGLQESGAKSIEPIDIANYLETNAVAAKEFKDQNGMEFLQDAIDFSSVDTFDYYYTKLKKLNLLRDLKRNGFDTSDIYDENLIESKSNEINSKFEQLSLKDICDIVKKKFLKIESDYSKSEEVQVMTMSDDIETFIDDLGKTIDIGLPVQGRIYNKIIGGAELGALTIRSGSSGLGKALPNSTWIPTTKGWRQVDNVKVGDYLYDRHGKPTKILAVYPQANLKRIYRVYFSSGKTAECCAEHLWSYYSSPHSKKLKTKTLKQIYNESKRNKFSRFGHYCYRVPNIEAVEMDEKSYRITPYDMGLSMAATNGMIPNDYLIGSRAQRLDLLRGLMAAQGRQLGSDEKVLFTTTSAAMKEIVLGLTSSLGIQCKSFVKSDISDKPVYFIYSVPKEMRDRYGNTDPIVDIKKTDIFEQMTCFYVDNDEHLFAAGFGWWITHNTRQAIADACYLAYPTRYDSNKQKWVQMGSSEKVLFIITEQTYPQIRRMALAYLTDINESRFKTGRFTTDEIQRLKTAQQVINDFSDNMVIMKMPSPTIELLKTNIREQCLTKDIHYVFFDYIFINPALLSSFRGFSLRDDEILLMVASALKDLAVELNVAMFTSTQVNAKADDNKNIRNEASLAGGRSTINKADNGAIMARPTSEELEILAPLSTKYGTPNMVTDIFKVRSGEWTQLRIWSKVDLGRMKKEDLYVTDAHLDAIENFWADGEDFEVHNWDTEEYQNLLNYIKLLNPEEKKKGLLDGI